ncbi:MAG: hypothetical protein R6X15_06425 [Pseudomonadota bacterium]
MSASGSTTTQKTDGGIPVRVWVGYALPRLRQGKGRLEFYESLGSIFIPATVQIMQPLGLTAYLPTVLPANNNPAIPDEIALVFYPSCRHYEQAKNSSTGGRAYQKLHSTIFNFQPLPEAPKSHSSFPLLFDQASNKQLPNGNYSLFSTTVNWQTGNPVVLVAGFNTEARSRTIQRLENIQRSPPEGLDGLIFALQNDFIVVWAHWRHEPATRNILEGIEGLRIIVNSSYESLTLPMPVTTSFPGIPVTAGRSFNFQFNTLPKT